MKVTLECGHSFEINPIVKSLYKDDDYWASIFCQPCNELEPKEIYKKVVSVE